MDLVLDCSAALACCFEDEETAATIQLGQDIATGAAYVPVIWRLEVASGLRAGIKRGRLSPIKRDAMLERFMKLNIITDLETDRYAWSTTQRLSDKYGLTPYDASYLELAQRLSFPLATLDSDLHEAARRANIDLYPL